MKSNGAPRGGGIIAGVNDLATLRPDIAAQWHPAKNGELMPSTVGKGYSKKVWWVCDEGHEFDSVPYNRKSADSCPICSGKVTLTGFNDAATIYPHLIPAFHPSLNGDIELAKIGKSYSKKLWWFCSQGHAVSALVSNCRSGVPCEYCLGRKLLPGYNDVATAHPELLSFWHPTENLPLTPETANKSGKSKVWWICDKGHEDYVSVPTKISRGTSCAFCANTKFLSGLNDFETLYPEPAKLWHPTLNGDLTPSRISGGSDKLHWWLCNRCNQSWKASPSNRGKKGTGCPYCAGQKIKVGVNDLSTVKPEIANEWHPTKNGSLTPQAVTVGSPQSVWWLCKLQHEYQSIIRDRTIRLYGCNTCYRSGLPNGVKSLAEAQPHLLLEWDYEKNFLNPNLIGEYSNKSVFWVCANDNTHSWTCSVASRTANKSDCPVCWKQNATSKAEREIGDFLESLGLVVERSVRTLLGNKMELDLYLPDFKIAIEYNGLYWHSEATGKDKTYHYSKWKSCQENGITLIQIWEDDWIMKKDIVLRHLAYRFNKLPELQALYPHLAKECFATHFARKLKPSTISGREAQTFLDDYHIQGFVKGSSYQALKTSDGRIVAVMVFTKTGKAGEFVLARYATEGKVVGGFTKLLKASLKELKPNKVITFADRAISSGALYENNGFIVDGIVKPDYMYVKNKQRHHKFGYRLERFRKDPNLIWEAGLKERELAELNGLFRIWDAGKVRYSLVL